MDLTALSKNLCKLSAANEKVNEFVGKLRELRVALSDLQQLYIFIAQCEKLSAELESERRSHAEELRQINQDINHLEDTLKNVRNAKDTKKENIVRKYNEMERELDFTNELLCESGIPETDLMTNEILFPSFFDELIDCSTATKLPFMTPLVLNQLSQLSFLEMLNRHRNHNLGTSNQISVITGASNTSGATVTTSVRTIFSTISEPAKTKKCQSCEQLIHRNAPICPRCKTKSQSKYSKRPRKID